MNLNRLLPQKRLKWTEREFQADGGRMNEAELIRLYEEFSEDVYHAGFMSWQHRPAILFEEFPRWLRGARTASPARTDYQQALVDAWRNHDHDEDEQALWAALADLQGDA